MAELRPGTGAPGTAPRTRHAGDVRSLPLLLLLLLSGCYVGPGIEPPPAREVTETPAELAAMLVSRANAARAQRGLQELATDAMLAAAAQDFAVELAQRGTLTHTSRRAGFTRLLDRIDRAGGKVLRAGENLAMMSSQSGMPAEVVRLWLASSGHRRNLLNDDYTITGAGVVRGANRTWYFVQVYATPPRRR